MAKYTIREADQDDLSGITRLRHTIKEFRPIDTREYESFWNSKIYNNPCSIRNVYIGMTEKKEIMAHLAMMPYKFLKDGEPIIGGSLCELMVHENCRKELLFPRVEMKVLSVYKGLGVDFAYGMANRGEVMNAHLSFGFRKIGDLEVYAKPFKLANLARSMIKNNFLNTIMKPVLFIAEKVLGSINTYGQQGLDTTEISMFDQAIDQFLEEVQRHFPYTALRNSGILNWRFASSPAVKYYILVTKEQGNIIGYAVLRRVVIKGFETLAIVDILFSPDRTDAGKSLMSAVHKKARELDVEMTACLLNPHDPICPVIKKCGYYKTPETFALIIHEPRGPVHHFNKDSFSKWHLTWFDHDAL